MAKEKMDQSRKNRVEMFQRLAKQSVWILRKEENGNITLELFGEWGTTTVYSHLFFHRIREQGTLSLRIWYLCLFLFASYALIELPEQICGIVIEPFGDNIPFKSENATGLLIYRLAACRFPVKDIAADLFCPFQRRFLMD